MPRILIVILRYHRHKPIDSICIVTYIAWSPLFAKFLENVDQNCFQTSGLLPVMLFVI
jgi:hypothetical protein